MKGIKICGDCANYNWKKHKCNICEDEGNPSDPFYADCPLPDVEEVKHGAWAMIPPPKVFKEGEYVIFQCSECGCKYAWTDRFCPNCGARMDGVEETDAET